MELKVQKYFRRRQMKKILIYGYYGLLNAGDDYIMLSVLNTLKNMVGKDSITILSASDDYRELKLNDNVHIKILPANRWIRSWVILKEVIKNNYFIIGGGGLWPNDSWKKVFVHLMWISIGRLLGTHCILYGIELTFVRNDLTKKIWRKIIQKTDWIITRNRKSKELLNDISVSNKVKAYSDITFSITDSEINDFRNSTLSNKIETRYIIWALAMPWSEDELQKNHYIKRYEALVSALVELSMELDKKYPSVTHLFIPFYQKNDVKLAHDIISMRKQFNAYLYKEHWLDIRPLFAHAEFAVCMRFHSVLFALYEMCDFVAISYSPKTTDLLEEIGCPLYTEFGIREKSYFYKEIDLDINEYINKMQQLDFWKNKKIAAKEQLVQKGIMASQILKGWIEDE